MHTSTSKTFSSSNLISKFDGIFLLPPFECFHFQDLRSKNRKAMEALNEMEQKYVKLLKAQS